MSIKNCEVSVWLQNGVKNYVDNIALRSSHILYIFVLRAIKITIFEPEVVIFPACNTSTNIQYTKFANFAGLYFPHFTTFRNQTLQSYSF